MTAAIVLSGGRGSRLGGSGKAHLDVGGVALLDGVLDAVAAAGIDRIVVVGDPPARARSGVVVTREDPPFAGPVAGIAAGLDALGLDRRGEAERLLLLACDLPGAGDLVAHLLAVGPPGPDGLLLVDAGGRRQWLAGVYRTGALADGVARLRAEGPLVGLPLRALVGPLDVLEAPDPADLTRDVDTPEDLIRERMRP